MFSARWQHGLGWIPFSEVNNWLAKQVASAATMWTTKYELPGTDHGLNVFEILGPMVVPRENTRRVRPHELTNSPRLIAIDQRQRGKIMTEFDNFNVEKNANKIIIEQTIEKFARR